LLDRYFTDRIQPMLDAYNAQVDQFGPRPAPGAAADAAQAAAEAAVGALRGARSSAAAPFYQAADAQHVDAAAIGNLIDQLDAITPGRGTALEAEIKKMRDALTTGRIIDPATGAPPVPDPITGITPAGVPEPLTLIEPLSDLYRSTRGRIDAPIVARDAIDSVVAGRIGPINDQLRAILETNPDFAAGQSTYRAMSPAVTAAERSPVGTIATAGREVGPPRIEAMIRAFSDPEAIRQQDIAFTARALNASNPAAFRGLVQVYLTNALERQLGKGGLAHASNPRVGAMVQDALGKIPSQAAGNIEAMLRELAVPAGLNPDEVIAGWRDLMTTLDRTGRIPAAGSRTAMRAELAQAASANPVAVAADLASTSPFRTFANWLSESTARGAYRDVARALVAPDSLAAMAELARTGRITPRTMWLLQQAVAGDAAMQDQ
jgi:hypothetical protein